MDMYKRIMYWKWDAAIFDPGQLEIKIADIYSRAFFDLVYVSLHHIHLPFHDSRIIEAVARCTDLLKVRGAKLMLDVEPRNEGMSFFARYPGSRIYLTRPVEIPLDASGRGAADIDVPIREHYGREPYADAPDAVINAWAFTALPGRRFEAESLANIKASVFMEDLGDRRVRFHAEAGEAHAGKLALVFPAVAHAIPDPFSPAFYAYTGFMFDQLQGIPLGGVANDEWGIDICLQLDEETGKPYLQYFPYSSYMSLAYESRTGRPLEADLLYLTYAPALPASPAALASPEEPADMSAAAPAASTAESGDGIRCINDYIGTLRAGMKANNDWFYAKGKAMFGDDAFIGVHPTLWGDPTDFNFDVLLNGLDWWEVKRDFAQTDEGVLFPIRLALAHKWGGTVWYNMFYSAYTLKLETYFAETWRNARFGGRTHYLGYECPNEGCVLELYQPGHLERIGEMEQAVALLNDFQTSQPDSRVLVVFGMEAATNWRISDPDSDRWAPRGRNLHLAADFAKRLFDGGYLCDFVPSSEIANGDVKLDGNQARYGTQRYDAVIFLLPEAMDKQVLSFMLAYKRANPQLILSGRCTIFSDGTDASAAFAELTANLAHYDEEPISADAAIQLLRNWGVPGNIVDGGCIYQDGSAIFTAEGHLHRGNPLTVDCLLKGRRITVECEDFFAIDLDADGGVRKFAGCNIRSFAIDGKNAL